MKIQVDSQIKDICPDMQLGTITCNVVNSSTSDELWQLLLEESYKIKNSYPLDQISKRPAIAATRALYKGLGKDPNRYRVSSEALCRRIAKGMELYRINTLVDIINVASFMSGYSIGGFDLDKISGDTLTLRPGKSTDIFNAIGRGVLNIESLPVYFDEVGGVGSPTSDEERTKISIDTTRIFVNINAIAPEMPLNELLSWLEIVLTKYASATNIQKSIITI